MKNIEQYKFLIENINNILKKYHFIYEACHKVNEGRYSILAMELLKEVMTMTNGLFVDVPAIQAHRKEKNLEESELPLESIPSKVYPFDFETQCLYLCGLLQSLERNKVLCGYDKLDYEASSYFRGFPKETMRKFYSLFALIAHELPTEKLHLQFIQLAERARNTATEMTDKEAYDDIVAYSTFAAQQNAIRMLDELCALPEYVAFQQEDKSIKRRARIVYQVISTINIKDLPEIDDSILSCLVYPGIERLNYPAASQPAGVELTATMPPKKDLKDATNTPIIKPTPLRPSAFHAFKSDRRGQKRKAASLSADGLPATENTIHTKGELQSKKVHDKKRSKPNPT